MTTATAKRIESEIASLRSEVAELRAHIVIAPPRDEDTISHEEMALWDRASASDFSAFATKHKA